MHSKLEMERSEICLASSRVPNLHKMTNRELQFLKEKYSGNELTEAIKRFESGEPLAYVLGEWYFYGLTFKLNDACLIPRPDTEHIVEKTIETVKKGGAFADLCTGSGCIAISVLNSRPDLTCFSYDISEKALEKARENAALNGVSERVNFACADVFTLELEENSLDCIVSNPPYIQTAVIDTLETVQREPRIALDGGSDGLDFYRHIIEHFAPALKSDGCFIFEIGYDQADALRALASSHSLSCSVFKDYGGNDRCAVLKKERYGRF
ncbi:MAG: peptide chain release factor N(5)-glutamine methyltransferase [Ruminococcaceae bacterium]|nr:peptide chain release factor N(5)-glutamine methyltransferase [Oscillospiraceae bacterium]